MVEWRFFGRFNPELGAGDSSPNSGEVGEVEARRRMSDRSARLEFVPPVDVVTGRVPFVIRVSLSLTPVKIAYTVFLVNKDGLTDVEFTWFSLPDGRLFMGELILYRYDVNEWTAPVRRGDGDYDVQMQFDIDEAGHADVLINEQKNGRLVGQMRGEQMFNPALLFRDAPAWGHWDELVKEPPMPGA